MSQIRGKIWKFGHDVDTDSIIPARYLMLPMEEMKEKTMEPICPEFADRVQPGEIIVAGRNFGCGSSREQAPAVLEKLGVRAIVAISFARIFFRNAINLGMPVLACEEIYDVIQNGDRIGINPISGQIHVMGKSTDFFGSRLPDFLMEVIQDGGLVPYLAGEKKKTAQAQKH